MKKRNPARLVAASTLTAAIALGGSAGAIASPVAPGKPSRPTGHKIEHVHKVDAKKAKALSLAKAKAAREVAKKVAATDKVGVWLAKHDLGTVDDALFARVAADKQTLNDYKGLIASATTVEQIKAPAAAVVAFKPEVYRSVHTVLANNEGVRKKVNTLYAGFEAVEAAYVEAGVADPAREAKIDAGVALLDAAVVNLNEGVAVANSVTATRASKSSAATLTQARGKTVAAAKKAAAAKAVLDTLIAPEVSDPKPAV